EDVPHEPVECACRLVVTVFLDRLGHRIAGARGLAGDPAIDGNARANRIEILIAPRPAHLAEPCGIPQLGCKIAIALDTLGGELDVAPLCGIAASVKRNASAPYRSM